MKENEDLTSIFLKDEMLKFTSARVILEKTIHRCPFCECDMIDGFTVHICGTEIDHKDREDWVRCEECLGFMIYMGGRLLQPVLTNILCGVTHCVCVIPKKFHNDMVDDYDFIKLRKLRFLNMCN